LHTPTLSETPSSKLQTPENIQIPNTNPQHQIPRQTARRVFFGSELDASLELANWTLSPCCLLVKDGDVRHMLLLTKIVFDSARV